jgi:hypothetical protein
MDYTYYFPDCPKKLSFLFNSEIIGLYNRYFKAFFHSAIILTICNFILLIIPPNAFAKVLLCCADPFKNYQPLGKFGNSLRVQQRILMGESEGYYFWIENLEDNDIIIEYQKLFGLSYQVQVYLPIEVELKKGKKVYDVLKPLNSNDSIGKRGRYLLYVRVTTPVTAKAGSADLVLNFREPTGNHIDSLIINVSAFPVFLPPDIPVMLQGSISQQKDWYDLVYPEARDNFQPAGTIRKMQAILKEYRFNALAGMRPGILLSDQTYRELIGHAVEHLEYKRVRLATNEMYSWANPLPAKWHNDIGARDKTLLNIRLFLDRWNNLTAEKAFQGKLSFKLWDEPRKQDVENVIFMYQSVKKFKPELILEISDTPIPELENTVNMWVPNLKRLMKWQKSGAIEHQHTIGNEVWFYENRLHDIDSPYGSMRYIGWLLWQYKLNGYHIWAVNKWDYNPLMPHTKADKLSKTDDSFSRGLFLYPDPQNGEIYSSIRLENLRDGMDDLLLLNIFENNLKTDQKANQDASNLLIEAKNISKMDQDFKNSESLLSLRNRIIEIIASE